MAEPVRIGMDLGTSKTAVVSSEGRRAVIPTAIGRPKDSVSQMLFDQSVLLGDDLLKHPQAVELVRPLQFGQLKFVEKDELRNESGRTLSMILEYALAKIGLRAGTAAMCVLGIPARASVDTQKFLVGLGERYCGRVMTVSEPFVVAYGLGALTDSIVVDIGAGTIDVCPLAGTFPQPEQQVTMPFGGDAVDELFAAAVTSAYPKSRCSLATLRDLKERHGTISGDAAEVPLTLVVDGRPRAVNVLSQLRSACEALVDPIVKGIAECLGFWDNTTQERMLRNVILAGGGSRVIGLDVAIEKILRECYGIARVIRVHDSQFAGANGALKLAMEMPTEHWESLSRAA